ncbi:MAG: metal-dependent hydrolase [Lachnospiraceae bacterium]|nr:metal-dependent hydrolase [Lachnospiraceae bacterium]
MVTITFYGHACFGITDGKTALLTDPYLSGNAMAAASADEVDADYILVTHGHGDHVGDTPAIAERTGAKIITPVEIGSALFAGFSCLSCNLGGTLRLPFGSVKLIPAIHGSGVPGALACGFVITIGGKKICHLGDTALTKDFELLAEEKIDVLLTPIGDVYTMGPDDAARAAGMIRPGLVIPMHYGTFPALVQDPEPFVEACKEQQIPARVLNPGEAIHID